MDFTISEEQSMLADSVSRFIDNDYDFELRQKNAASADGYSKELWQTFAELGWTAVPFAGEDGGLDGGPVEMMLMMQQFGRGLMIEPFLANIVLAGGVLRRTATAEQKEKWLAPLIEGGLQTALAFAEPQARFDIANIATTAVKDGSDYVLTGKKSLVLNGGNADLLIIPARTAGDATDEQGITLFAVASGTEGMDIKSFTTVDASTAAEIDLRAVRIAPGNILGSVDEGFAALQAAIDEATLAVSAEAAGIIRAMHDKTVAYSKERVQFGVPISSFQALQHRMVDMLMAAEQTQSLLMWCVMLNTADDAGARKAISALKYQVGTAGIKVAQEAVQIHGAMGVTWELDIAHYFKRLTAIDLLFGNADFHLDRFINLSQ